MKPKREPKEHYTYPPILQRSRDMPHPLTPAESKLWARVRNNQLGVKIRRQPPIFRFIADFYCASAKLIIEIDGDTHAEPDHVQYDAARTQWLEERGYRVMRFSNIDVHHRLLAVLQNIQHACVVASANQVDIDDKRIIAQSHPLPAGEGRGEGDL